MTQGPGEDGHRGTTKHHPIAVDPDMYGTAARGGLVSRHLRFPEPLAPERGKAAVRGSRDRVLIDTGRRPEESRNEVDIRRIRGTILRSSGLGTFIGIIPGVGEEALAFLGRGDYFGEMALIDRLPRSAEAKAHSEGALVLSIPRDVLEGILNIQKVSSVRLLRLLGSLVAHRLRESDNRLVGWHVLAAGQSGG